MFGLQLILHKVDQQTLFPKKYTDLILTVDAKRNGRSYIKANKEKKKENCFRYWV